MIKLNLTANGNAEQRVKDYLEDFVMKVIWRLLVEQNHISEIAKQILKKHETVCKQDIALQSLESRRDALVKASGNLIAAIEQGIITEQTKTRLKELETEISELEFEIEREKQRNYTFLTQSKIEAYLQGVVNGDIQNLELRKKIIKIFIREIILYKDKMTLVFNFTEQTPLPPRKRYSYDDLSEVEGHSNQVSTALSSYSQSSGRPKFIYCREFCRVRNH